jgi:RHH-type transcriptional regulator, proline utilization regulon repressor / proline dehydrogenase / delta 1-pyrroline-5-carboxylate dehydrogenase
MDRDVDLEAKTREAGQELYAAMSGAPPVFDTSRWLGNIMDRAMGNEDFKLRLFRFIDVLPSLKTDEQIIRLLREYFSGETEIPTIVRSGIGMLLMTGLVPHLAGPLIRKSVESIARQFIAGKDAEGAGKALDDIRQDGTDFSIDLLGEVVASETEARAYAGRYHALLDVLHARSPEGARPDVSIKISSLYSQLDPLDWEGSIEQTKEGLRPLLRKARALGISITFDMEHFYYKGLIIAIFKSLFEEEEFREFPSAGIALQAYLRDTATDVPELMDWARARGRKIAIRLVKGAYWDYEVVINRQKGWPVPVFLSKEETDNSFERLTRLLFENIDILRPAIASHNLRSISHAIACAGALNIPKEAFEFQMLYGMAEPLRKAVRARGFNVRVYAPVGEMIPGMAYLVRRLLENTSNESFLRKSFSERSSFEELIKAPLAGRALSGDGVVGAQFRNEPPLDFSMGRNRTAMSQALRTIKEHRNREYPLYIGDREVTTVRDIASRNPARPGEIIGRVSSAAKIEADAAIEEALKAGKTWRATAPDKRAGYLFQAAQEMRNKRMELAALEVLEVGKTWKDADGDVCEAIDYLEYYGREMLRLGVPAALGNYAGEKNEYRYEAKGIGVVISPWNFPLAIAAGMTSAAIVTGNCVIFKPSGLSPLIGHELCEIYRSIGFPAGVFQFLPGPGSEVGEYLVSHPAMDFIAFTGSMEVGISIVERAGIARQGQRNVKKVIAEMGGKNAIIVDETADLDEAVKSIVESAFGYQGQKCSACSRVVVVGDIFKELCDRLAEAAKSIRLGPPEEPGTFMGPVIDEAAMKKIRTYIEIGKKEGTIILDRNAPDEGYFVGPVIVIDVKPGSRIAAEEIFGPVLSIMRARDIDAAIRIANDSIYTLTGGLFSRSPENIQRVKEEFHVGNLYINRKITGALVGRQPFGGFGMSGTGSKAGGPDYLLQFMNPVSISENTIRRGFAPLTKD